MRVNANVILARCKRSAQLYGMRVQEYAGDWICTWAFPIREDQAVSEGFDKVKINGSFQQTEDYPGCPYCESKDFFICGYCGKITCWSGDKTVKCAWCGKTARTEIVDRLDVTGGGY